MSAQVVDTLAAGAVFLGAVLGWVKGIRPRLQRLTHDTTAVRDTLLGREEVVDTITGRRLAPALPGIGERMTTVEETLQIVTGAIAKLADTHERLDSHDRRLRHLEEHADERQLARTESIELFRTMGAAIEADPPEKEK